MNWPELTDYHVAIQNPHVSFQDADLKAGQVRVNNLGLPTVASGNFASVYQIRRGTSRWAVRCFSRQVSDQQQRYALLSTHLKRTSLPYLVNFEFIQQGIRVKGQYYPIVKMGWVDGVALHTFVGQNVNNPKQLIELATQWQSLISSLRANNIAHGDLQHGNVIITGQNEIKLVDYDAMFVPALSNKRSPELGHPSFQHPLRQDKDCDEKLDNFAALVIFLSLYALAADSSLWSQYHTGENLIFSAQDYKTPGRSPVFKVLVQSKNQIVQTLAKQLSQCCSCPVSVVPDFAMIVRSLPLNTSVGNSNPQKNEWWKSHNGSVVPPSPPPPITNKVPPWVNQTIAAPPTPSSWLKVPKSVARKIGGWLSISVVAIAFTAGLHFGNHNTAEAQSPNISVSSITPPTTNNLPARDASYEASKTEATQLVQDAKNLNNKISAKLFTLQDEHQRGALTEENAATAKAEMKPLLQEALANSEHAISLDSSNKDAWFQRVCTLYFWGKYPEADHYLRQATAKFPDCNDFDPLRPLIEKHLR